ncbi:ferrous iron transport protein A [Megalodesulfovibrio paquesii]
MGDCPAMRSRLLALGLTPGSTATVESCGCGQCCLCVRGGSLAIGHGMADKILVRLVSGEAGGASGVPTASGATSGCECRCSCREAGAHASESRAPSSHDPPPHGRGRPGRSE